MEQKKLTHGEGDKYTPHTAGEILMENLSRSHSLFAEAFKQWKKKGSVEHSKSNDYEKQ